MSNYIDVFRQARPLTFGFDQMFNTLENVFASEVVNKAYPPYNVIKTENGYEVHMALAGFNKDNIKVEHDREVGILSVSGEMETKLPEGHKAIKLGIAGRKFRKEFTVADNIKVTRAEMKDGILTVELSQIKRAVDKPLSIPIL